MSVEEDQLSVRAKYTLLAAITLSLLALTVAAAEIAIRVRQTLKYGSHARVEEYYTLDEKSGLRVPIAGLKLGNVEVNSHGFRGPEIKTPKPDGTVRIAFLGASTTWCAEVSSNSKVWAHLVTEGLQQANPAVRLDYVNGGVSGFGVDASLRNLQHRVAPLQPDIVVIYHATNDMSSELRAVAAARGVAASASVRSESWLARQSLLWNLAEKNWRIWQAQRDADSNVGRLEVDAETLGEPFRKDLTELVLAAKRAAKVVALATFSTQLRIEQSAEDKRRASASAMYYMPFMHPDGLIASYRRYNQVIREVAAATGAVLIDGEDTIPGDSRHFTDTVHFTDAGSERMAVRVRGALSGNEAVRSVLRSGVSKNAAPR